MVREWFSFSGVVDTEVRTPQVGFHSYLVNRLNIGFCGAVNGLSEDTLSTKGRRRLA